ncbi:hypothetical protein B0T17DRAFT_538464 [Bombardia bombarda]|uniref:F-box domain-containing protein n=1 Tax=Bombardia bombarda TaxID=252184 RepID=A0AA39WHR0_9PEZI|nr:hypothetical protein B0T17DRAFT_538464 [Bombardia bombarda]
MLTRLPQEVFDMIAGMLPYKTDLKALSLVSRDVYTAVAPTLWRSLSIRVDDAQLAEGCITSCIDLKPPCVGNGDSFIRHVHRLTFESEHRRLFYGLIAKCPHKMMDENDRNTFLHAYADNHMWFGGTVGEIIEDIPPDQLSEFVWNLGICLPDNLLSSKGLLAIEQPLIRSLRLHTSTEPECDNGIDLEQASSHWEAADNNDISPWPFRRLKQLAWIGPKSSDILTGTLASAIQHNSEHLEELELDLVKYYPLVWRPPPSETTKERIKQFFAAKVFFLGDAMAAGQPPLKALEFLSLSHFPLAAHLASKLVDISQLRSLILRSCLGWVEFLTAMTSSGLPIRLKVLEVVSQGFVDGRAREVLTNFINAFEGLEELYIWWPIGQIVSTNDWDGIASGHRATLKRLIHCDCGACISVVKNGFGMECIGTRRLTKVFTDELSKAPRAKQTLKFLHTRYKYIWNGEHLGESPSWLRPDLERSSESVAYSLTDEEDASRRTWLAQPPASWLAEWAFGPDGLPSLEAVALGPTSHPENDPHYTDKKVEEENIILCRSVPGARVGQSNFNVPRRGGRLWTKIVDEYGTFMRACPHNNNPLVTKEGI